MSLLDSSALTELPLLGARPRDPGELKAALLGLGVGKDLFHLFQGELLGLDCFEVDDEETDNVPCEEDEVGCAEISKMSPSSTWKIEVCS